MRWHALACKEPPWQAQLDALDEKAMQNMHISSRVLRMFDTHPGWSSGRIARALGVCSGYVRKTLTRNGRKLAKSKKYGW